eukprot:457511-Pleurochrysis_carterae.AAC.2
MLEEGHGKASRKQHQQEKFGEAEPNGRQYSRVRPSTSMQFSLFESMERSDTWANAVASDAALHIVRCNLSNVNRRIAARSEAF